MPVWVALSVLALFEPAQYLSKSFLSNHGVAGALVKAHTTLVSKPGVYGSIEVVHLTEDTMNRCIGTALREYRYLTGSLDLLVRDHMYPKAHSGVPHPLGACVVCSEGCDKSMPLPVAAEPGEQRGVLEFTETITSRPAKVRCLSITLAFLPQTLYEELQSSPVNHGKLIQPSCKCDAQVHLDGCMKLTHFESAGRRENALELDDKLPTNVFLTDRERDKEDAQIASELSVSASDCKACNNFKADKLVSRCAPLCSHPQHKPVVKRQLQP